MKKQLTIWSIISALVMLMLPWLAVTFAPADAGMAICFILFYAINPIYSIIIGYQAGRNVKALWPLPMISAVLFLIGTWIFFTIAETIFIVYAVIYLVLGLIAMFITSKFIKKGVTYARNSYFNK